MKEETSTKIDQVRFAWTQEMTISTLVAIGFIIALVVYTPDAWGSYMIVTPMILMTRLKQEANITWKASKKHTILAYTLICTYCIVALKIGVYLTNP